MTKGADQVEKNFCPIAPLRGDSSMYLCTYSRLGCTVFRDWNLDFPPTDRGLAAWGAAAGDLLPERAETDDEREI